MGWNEKGRDGEKERGGNVEFHHLLLSNLTNGDSYWQINGKMAKNGKTTDSDLVKELSQEAVKPDR